MSRARHQESLNAVQLFPFVAVLLCTMGSLLVLLVAVSRTSRVQAEQQVAEAKARAVAAPPVDEKMRAMLEQARQHLAMLKKQESLAKEHLQNDQRTLSHLEDHMRRLQTDLESLRVAAAEMNSLEKNHFDDREQGQRELVRLRELIDDRTQAIAELRKEMGSRRTYAIIPFETPGATKRPPVYFECRKDGVYLLPEEIRFTIADFRGPNGSSTPVAAAFRAAREHLINQGKIANPTEETEPYALVVVRPEGLVGSKFLMRALDEAGIAFGYEIVESDAEITYPLANPKLLEAEIQAVETARGRMEMFAAAAPRAYENHDEIANVPEFEDETEVDPNSYADDESSYDSGGKDSTERRGGSQMAIDSYPGGVRPGGGGSSRSGRGGGGTYVAAVPTGVRPLSAATGGPYRSGGGGGSPGGNSNNAGAAVGGGGTGGVAGGAPSGMLPTGSVSGFGGVSGQKPTEAGIVPGGVAATNVGSVNGSGGYGIPGSGGSGQSGGAGGNGGAEAGSGNANGPGGSSNGGANGGGSGGAGGGTNGNAPANGAVAGGPSNGATGGASSGGASGPAPLGAATANGQASPNGSTASGPVEFGNYDPNALSSSERLSNNDPAVDRYADDMPGPTPSRSRNRPDVDEDEDQAASRRRPQKIRGKDWAIRSRKPGSVPLRRTIHVVVRGDRLAILPEHGANDDAGKGREIALVGPTYVARDDISEALEKHIQAWGMAGEGLYWRPVIEVSVSADGQRRAEDLARLLKNSGIELKTSAVAQNSEGGAPSASR